MNVISLSNDVVPLWHETSSNYTRASSYIWMAHATLESRHNTLGTVLMYKIMNTLVDVPTDTILSLSTLQLRGHTEKLLQL